jgi:hypothetical protein
MLMEANQEAEADSHFGCRSKAEVFMPIAHPSGQISATVSRQEKRAV